VGRHGTNGHISGCRPDEHLIITCRHQSRSEHHCYDNKADANPKPGIAMAQWSNTPYASVAHGGSITRLAIDGE